MGIEYKLIIGGVAVEEFKVASNGNCGAMDFVNRFIATLSPAERKAVAVVSEYETKSYYGAPAAFSGDWMDDADECFMCEDDEPQSCTHPKVMAKYVAFVNGTCVKVDDNPFCTTYYYKGYTIDVDRHYNKTFIIVRDHITTELKPVADFAGEALDAAKNEIDFWQSHN